MQSVKATPYRPERADPKPGPVRGGHGAGAVATHAHSQEGRPESVSTTALSSITAQKVSAHPS